MHRPPPRWGPASPPPFMNRPPGNFQRGPGPNTSPRGGAPFPGPPGGPRHGPPGQRPNFHGNQFQPQQRPDFGGNRFGGPPRGPGNPPPRHQMGPRFGPGAGPGPRFMGGPPRPQHPQHPRHPHHGNQFQHGKGGGGQNKKGQKQQKQQQQKAGKEESNFYCDTCDRGYKLEEEYKKHTDSHVKCKDPECSYVAAEKLVKLHYQMQHITGLAKKIWTLESKEDIEKWREERRRKFPTAVNIEKKKAEQADREDRGEVIETKYFGKMRGRGRGRGRGERGGHSDRKRTNQNLNNQPECSPLKQRKSSTEVSTDVSATQQKVRDPNADPLSYVLDNDDEDLNTNQDSGVSPAGPVAGGALGKLFTLYTGSTDSEEEEEEEEQKKSGQKNTRKFQRPDTRKRQRNKRNKNKQGQRFQPDKKPQQSLLEKLLAKELRQERNKIMQCVYYVVKSNFFMEGETPVGETPVGETPVGEKETSNISDSSVSIDNNNCDDNCNNDNSNNDNSNNDNSTQQKVLVEELSETKTEVSMDQSDACSATEVKNDLKDAITDADPKETDIVKNEDTVNDSGSCNKSTVTNSSVIDTTVSIVTETSVYPC